MTLKAVVGEDGPHIAIEEEGGGLEAMGVPMRIPSP